MKISDNHSTTESYSTPIRYRQPTSDYSGRVLRENIEDVSFSSESNVRIWYNTQDEGYSLHAHDSLEIIICVRENYEIHVNKQVYNMTNGDILIIPPNTLHEYINDHSGIRFIYLIRVSELFEMNDYNLIEQQFFNGLLINRANYPVIYDKVHSILMDMQETYFSQNAFWEYRIFAKLYEMFAIVADRLHKDSPTPVVPEQGSYDTIQKLISFIDNNYASDMKINEAAAITGFSKYHFLRLFTKYTGYTFHEYVMLKRIQASENLLSTNASITDVAYSTGFQSSSSFSRAFKKLTGKTPREYKKLIISENIEEHDT
ncbi:AraC family transcriptional regulator [Eubacterium ruminantium]|uniref:AraC family transcriptional regulator n=1 Tax=Eubacterium ruminantium TaxID=42322 RepID=UPI0015691C88|nr:AraC family transcriptional regulator [Eubacterium ruminantium]